VLFFVSQVDPQARIIREAYPYVASRVLTDPQDELQEALRRLALTSDGHVRWERLESLLDEAKGSSGYDVTAALDQLTNYLISDDGEPLLSDLSIQIVDAADSLGSETVGYIFEASRALSINDEVAAVRAFRALQEVVQRQGEVGGIQQGVRDNLEQVLPEATPSMKRFWGILSLLGAQGGQADPSKFVPIVRKLGQEPRVQRMASEILARLGERVLSRGLRAAFGLPPPVFNGAGMDSTVTEDRIRS
jgi:aarF domain-containing kinase